MLAVADGLEAGVRDWRLSGGPVQCRLVVTQCLRHRALMLTVLGFRSSRSMASRELKSGRTVSTWPSRFSPDVIRGQIRF
jgi:hypothetical protein